MSRTYLHTQQAKYREELYEEQDFMQRYINGRQFYWQEFPHSKKLGWHKLANLYEWRHERTKENFFNSRSCKQLRHTIARRYYLSEKKEHNFAPIIEPRFRKNKCHK